jgi:Protein of unknown function (DUF2800)
MTPAQKTMLETYISLLPVDSRGGRDKLFRPSSIDRVILCHGSTGLIARLPPEPKRRSTKAQSEGTACHKVVEQALLGIRQPDEWTDRMVVTDPGGLDGEFVDAEMSESAQWFVDLVKDRIPEGDDCTLLVEQKLSLSPLDPKDPLLAENAGTGDVIILNRTKRRITICDLKYGKGVMVPGDSPQLKDYGLMALVSYDTDGGWNEIETVVGQPRAVREDQREKSVVFTAGELLGEFLPELINAMEASLDDNATLTPSEKGCRWCRAKHVCPKVADIALNPGQDMFSSSYEQRLMSAKAAGPITVPALVQATVDNPKPVVSEGTVVLPSILDLDPGDIATLFDRFEIYDMFQKAVKQRAAAMIQAGVTIPGWTMESRSGHRAFKVMDSIPPAFANLGATEKDIQSLLRALGVKTSDMMTEPKLRSPAQIEKKVPKAVRSLFDLLVFKPEGEPTLMRVTAGKASTTQAIRASVGAISEIEQNA